MKAHRSKRPKAREPIKVLAPPTPAMNAFMGGAMTEAAPPAPAPEAAPPPERAEAAPPSPETVPAPEPAEAASPPPERAEAVPPSPGPELAPEPAEAAPPPPEPALASEPAEVAPRPQRVRMRGLVPRAGGDLYKLPVLLQPQLGLWFKRFCRENEVHMSALAGAVVAPLIEELRALEDPTPEAIRTALARGERFPAAVAAAVCAIFERAVRTEEHATT